MRCGLTFRLARTHPARARSSGSETLSRSRSLVGYTIDTHETEVFGSHRQRPRASRNGTRKGKLERRIKREPSARERSMSIRKRRDGAPSLVERVAGNGLLDRRALLGRGIVFAGAMGTGAGTSITGAAAEPLQNDPWSLEMGSVVPAY